MFETRYHVIYLFIYLSLQVPFYWIRMSLGLNIGIKGFVLENELAKDSKGTIAGLNQV